ncbi:MAG: DMT family transporter [Burkholderiales bacterium]|nr:DMT family transporter [Burkholderiales bacterium]
MISYTVRGTILALSAAICWATMGVSAQYLLHSCNFTALDLVSIRLVAAGFLLLTVHRMLGGTGLLEPFANLSNFLQVFVAGIAIFLSQLTFMLSIKTSNAGIATIVVTTCPLICAIYLSFTEHRPFSVQELLSFLLALLGVVLLVTKGDFSSLDFSIAGVAWGLLAAVFTVAYSLQPRKIIRKIGVAPTVSWAMILGGIVACFFDPPWTLDVIWTPLSAASFAWIVVVGTVIAFWCYMASIKYISAVIVGLLVCVEPIGAYALSIILFHMHVGVYECIGIVLILSNVFMLSIPNEKFKAFFQRKSVKL